MRIEMNKDENLKAAVIESCINGTMTVKVAAERLNFSERYVKKLKARYKKYGVSSMMHGNCGKQPKHTISADIKSKMWEIWNIPELEECNFTHFQEILEEDFSIKISYAPLYRFLKSKGAKSPRKHKKQRLIIDVKKDLHQVNYYKSMVLLISSFMEMIKNTVCMVLLMMQHIKLQDYICVKMNVCMDI